MKRYNIVVKEDFQDDNGNDVFSVLSVELPEGTFNKYLDDGDAVTGSRAEIIEALDELFQ